MKLLNQKDGAYYCISYSASFCRSCYFVHSVPYINIRLLAHCSASMYIIIIIIIIIEQLVKMYKCLSAYFQNNKCSALRKPPNCWTLLWFRACIVHFESLTVFNLIKWKGPKIKWKRVQNNQIDCFTLTEQ